MATVNRSNALSALGLPFTDAAITASINVLPAAFGRMAAAGMFPPEGITTDVVELDIENHVITALPVTPGGAPSTFSRQSSETARFVKVPNITHTHVIRAGDIRGQLEKAGRTRRPATLVSFVNKELTKLKLKFDITLELMRTSALKGVVVDGAGVEIVNLFTLFGATKQTVFFDLSNANSDITERCSDVIGLLEDNLSGETMTGVKALVSADFFNRLIKHPKVEKFYLSSTNAAQLANAVRGSDGDYRPRQFEFGNILFEEYRANVPLFGGATQRIVAAGLGHAYPVGTMDSHVTYAAPPIDVRELDGEAADDSSDDALLHLSTELLKHGKGVEIQGQMNALPLWRRPRLVVELSAAAS